MSLMSVIILNDTMLNVIVQSVIILSVSTLYLLTRKLFPLDKLLLINLIITDKDFYRKICQNLPELNAIKLSFLSSMRLLLKMARVCP
jgi:hypothetical protein